MLKIIAAVSTNGVIGLGNSLPFTLSADLKRFKEKTSGSVVVQGHKTLCSIISKIHKPLPGRENIVLTRHPGSIHIDGVRSTSDFQEIVERAKNEDIFIIGGAEIYALALPVADEMHLTRVHAEVEGDVMFPQWEPDEWSLISSEKHSADDKNDFPFTWEVYRRRARYIEMSNCRTDAQRAEMQLILEAGHCPFCPEHLRKYHDSPTLLDGKYWFVSNSDYPYPAAKDHLILILKYHAETLAEVSSEAFAELGEILRWAEERFEMKGGGFFMRFGECLLTGGTIRHLHAHIATKKGIGEEGVRLFLG